VHSPVGFNGADSAMVFRVFRSSKVRAAVIAVATAAAALVAISQINRELAGTDVLAANNPVAAVAWAQAHCYSGLSLKVPEARTQTEVLLEVAAGFENTRDRRGIRSACDDAIRFGKPAINPRTLPSYTGEAPLYEAAEVAAVN
jgi:hypothetical protein